MNSETTIAKSSYDVNKIILWEGTRGIFFSRLNRAGTKFWGGLDKAKSYYFSPLLIVFKTEDKIRISKVFLKASSTICGSANGILIMTFSPISIQKLTL